MRLGFIVPTSLESINLNALNAHVTSAGYGAGKTAVCAAAADLIFRKHCDTIIIWGLAGSLDKAVGVNDILIGTSTAYRDYDIAPLAGSTGVGFVQEYAENIWVDLDPFLAEILYESMKGLFPERKVVKGKICSGDQFVQHASSACFNRVEKEAYAVDMESAALAHFCHLVDKNVKVGIVRIISDNADHNADINFSEFLEKFGKMNEKMYAFREKILAANSTLERLIPYKNDIASLVAEKRLFDEACHKMYDRILVKEPALSFDCILAGEGESCHFAKHLAEMFSVPLVKNVPAGKTFLPVWDTLPGYSGTSDGAIHHILAFASQEKAEKDWEKAGIKVTALIQE
jgi:adenosylhomocysteine nucleosidase